MTVLNGHKKVLAIIAVIGGVLGILTGATTFYVMWTGRVEAAVVQQRMVNEHDVTLKALVPKVDICHETNMVQDVQIGQTAKDIAALTEQVKTLAGLQQSYYQTLMREGRIPR